MRYLPFEFEDVDFDGNFTFTFKEVVFTQDFGDFEKGSTYDRLDMDLEEGTLTAFTVRGVRDGQEKFQLILKDK